MHKKALDKKGVEHYANTDRPRFGDSRYCPYCKAEMVLTTSRLGTRYYRIRHGEHQTPYCRKLAHTMVNGTFRGKKINDLIDAWLKPEPEKPVPVPKSMSTPEDNADVSEVFDNISREAASNLASEGIPDATLGTMPEAAPMGTPWGKCEDVSAAAPWSTSKDISTVTPVALEVDEAEENEVEEEEKEKDFTIHRPIDVLETGVLDDIAADNPAAGPLKTLKQSILYYKWAVDLAPKIRDKGGKYILVCRLHRAGTTKTGNHYYDFEAFWRNDKQGYKYDNLSFRGYCNRSNIAAAIEKRLPPKGIDGKFVKHTCLVVAQLRRDNQGKLIYTINNRNQIAFTIEGN